MEGRDRDIFQGTRQEMYSMNNTIFRLKSWLGDVVVAGLDYVGVECGLGVFIGKLVAALLLEVWANVESFTRAEFPVFAVIWIGVDEKQAFKGENCNDIVVESA